MKTKFCTLLFAIVASLVIVNAATYSGSCGNGVSWSLNTTTGVLKISGSGAMTDWKSDSSVPWDLYRENITSVSIGNNVTNIGGYAFVHCTGLTSVTIPNSVTSIGDYAFSYCGLTSVTIPNNVTCIGGDAFKGCRDLTSVTIGNSVTSIGDWAFYECTGLTSVTIPNSVTSIGYETFQGCTGLTSITIPNSVTSIENGAFYGCSGLTSVTIPNSVTSIREKTFFECYGLTSVTIPNSVTSIGERAFSGCYGLTSVTIPNSVTSIGYGAFSECYGLTSVTIPNSVTSIGEYAFSRCEGLTSVTIPNSVTDIGNYAFFMVPNIVYAGTASGSPWMARSMNGFVQGWLVYSDNTKTTLLACSSAVTGVISIPSSVTSIGKWAFYNCSGLTSVTIPNSVNDIGNSAFAYCYGLTSVTIPNSVNDIGDDAFLMVPNIVYAGTAFGSPWGAISMNGFVDGWLVYSDNTKTNLLVCSSAVTGEITIPNSVKSIGERAFVGCSGLTSVTIPNSVKSIGENAFGGCSGLTSVTIPNSVTSIGNDAFYGCSGITSVAWNAKNCSKYGGFGNQVESFTFGNEVETIPEFCCGEMYKLTSITIPNSVKSIEPMAFLDCSSLTSVTMGNSVTSIGAWAFSGCSSLTSIYVPCGEMERFKRLLSGLNDIAKYKPLPYKVEVQINNSAAGKVDVPNNLTICDNPLTLKAVSNYGYHFVQWSDGVKDNPRTIVLTQDSAFAAEFAKNEYQITTISSNPQWGTTKGDTMALYLDVVQLSATANYGYHFTRWKDRNNSNPRTITVTKDNTYAASFAKNVYSITKIANSEQGSISGSSQAEYLDTVTLKAVSNYGYHFTQWSDGIKDNPRTIVLTQDSSFTAVFAIDRSGKCGDNNTLNWTYDVQAKALAISGSGTLNSNYTFGLEAPLTMEKLIISEGVTSIGSNAFADYSTLQEIYFPTSMKTIDGQAFLNCIELQHIYNYRERPCLASETSFEGVNKYDCTLHVLSASVDVYKVATGWCDFYYIKTIDAGTETDPVEDVKVTPTETTANIIWPAVPSAMIYELTIKNADGLVVVTLIFNAQGQLTGIAFAPARNRQQQQVVGFNFTITGLNSGTTYEYAIVSKDSGDNELDTKHGVFQTAEDSSMGIDEIENGKCETMKILRNGQLYILRDGVMYNAQGARVE